MVFTGIQSKQLFTLYMPYRRTGRFIEECNNQEYIFTL